MTKLLQKVFEHVSSMPEEEQGRIASILREEIQEDALQSRADEARDEICRGDVVPFDPASKPEWSRG